jgi:hypothetical protein
MPRFQPREGRRRLIRYLRTYWRLWVVLFRGVVLRRYRTAEAMIRDLDWAQEPFKSGQ